MLPRVLLLLFRLLLLLPLLPAVPLGNTTLIGRSWSG